MLNVKSWEKRKKLFLGKKRKIFYHFWSKRGHGRKEESHFRAKGVAPILSTFRIDDMINRFFFTEILLIVKRNAVWK